jgi:mono/diheme cytochrome c family protein
MSAPNDADPKPKANHLPAVLVMLFAVSFVLFVPLLFIRFSERRAQAAGDRVVDEVMLAGERVYQRNCVGCHEPRGEGRSVAFPPLVGSSWLLDDKETPIRATLLGLAGPIEVGGHRFHGSMPNFGVTLSDHDLASVLTYARSSWGNKAGPITPDEVAQVRASLGNRIDPWTGEALLKAKQTQILR